MNRRTLISGAMTLTAGLALAGCSDSSADKASEVSEAKPSLKVSGAFMPEPTMDTMASGFFTVTNKGSTDKLTSVTSSLADNVTLHSTKGSAMKEQKSFDVPANGELDFARGGNHLMFESLKSKPKQGDKVAVTLHFQKSGAVEVEFPVKAATYNPKPGKHTSH
ncbi:copper chaperone PCu(A)C [Streptomyces sp. MZ04]|uniref:copper chaperone PCu(A)C n=1 Tax=Streptomyces sp. MZ04 TaxID=2559236 RepID=UPI00107EDCB0|nr:copper chaperone PCu(A)C [Streptomyces sp. MZ04]TGB11376.1 copper chaperone PCu(A)C [Streptomyces sp. MZ04]